MKMRYRNSKQKPRFKYIKMSLFILLLTAIGVLTNIKLKKEDLIEPATSEIQVFARSIEEEKQKLIVIDAGHGDEDPGSSISNVDEKDLNLQIALKLKSALEEEGYEVMMTRSDDTYLTLTERAEFANEVEADLFISIHQNSYIDDSTVSGIEVYYNESTKTESDEVLAQFIQTELVETTGARDRGIRAYDELVVTRKTEMPACLVELGYMTNKSELSLLQSDAYQYKLVTGMVNGINQFFES
ncbi:N-acetylmuramoyl-L-alanine amidase [Turicibacter sanguinis]|uniref:N-acetylmuramoyl-L-alanine amidase n=3 Tax=Bacteria TaxID=2 RepID=A0A6I3NP03_9FIRM|nr:N-acetylmuramoyl-L-alanine amidase [Akkermansia muciniphila]MTH07671.1 N-acetylmuramoyl-L-alanine amidase [Turicibacter sanguinis]MTH09680.1 N-acetylmuramoyl-L-alanine amidase [Turicibacter sanguinis]MTH12355.1 N-acetylmuramoyl-L-alanine amidase [Turicibacter sanguinis]MTH19328.1 N-acetylmuramoyl-L-alanine amidase [Turicibacter sanguinis]